MNDELERDKEIAAVRLEYAQKLEQLISEEHARFHSELEEANGNYRHTLSLMEDKTKDLINCIGQVVQENARLQNRNAELQVTSKTAESKLTGLETELKALRGRESALAGSNAALSAEVEYLRKQNQKLQEENEAIRKAASDKEYRLSIALEEAKKAADDKPVPIEQKEPEVLKDPAKEAQAKLDRKVKAMAKTYKKMKEEQNDTV